MKKPEPSWKKFENFEADSDERCQAMREWHKKRQKSLRLEEKSPTFHGVQRGNNIKYK